MGLFYISYPPPGWWNSLLGQVFHNQMPQQQFTLQTVAFSPLNSLSHGRASSDYIRKLLMPGAAEDGAEGGWLLKKNLGARDLRFGVKVQVFEVRVKGLDLGCKARGLVEE